MYGGDNRIFADFACFKVLIIENLLIPLCSYVEHSVFGLSQVFDANILIKTGIKLRVTKQNPHMWAIIGFFSYC